jgi:hypothetical protein
MEAQVVEILLGIERVLLAIAIMLAGMLIISITKAK